MTLIKSKNAMIMFHNEDTKYDISSMYQSFETASSIYEMDELYGWGNKINIRMDIKFFAV